jgi:hypothetical protein
MTIIVASNSVRRRAKGEEATAGSRALRGKSLSGKRGAARGKPRRKGGVLQGG